MYASVDWFQVFCDFGTRIITYFIKTIQKTIDFNKWMRKWNKSDNDKLSSGTWTR